MYKEKEEQKSRLWVFFESRSALAKFYIMNFLRAYMAWTIIFWQSSRQSLDGYKHVVGVENCPAVLSDGPHFPSEAARAKEAAQDIPTAQNTDKYHHIMEGIERKISIFYLSFGKLNPIFYQMQNYQQLWGDGKIYTILIWLICSYLQELPFYLRPKWTTNQAPQI